MRRRSQTFVGVVSALALIGFGGDAGAGAAPGDSVRLVARLSGAQEVPPADADGRGKAELQIHVDEGRVCFDVGFTRTGTPNRGHIHLGDAGVNGGIVVFLFELQSTPADPRHDRLERGGLSDCVTAEPALLAAIVANPDDYYVNLHNVRYPGGVIRCQLETT